MERPFDGRHGGLFRDPRSGKRLNRRSSVRDSAEWERTHRTRALTSVLALLAIALVVAPAIPAPPLPPLELFGRATDVGGSPLPVGTPLRAFIDGVEYSNLTTVAQADGSYALTVAGNSYTGSTSDTPWIKEGGDPGDLVVFSISDLTTTGSLFRESAIWEPGSALATDLREANGSKQPARVKIDAIVTRPADAGTQYAYVCNPSGGSVVDLSRFYLQTNVPGSVAGPIVPLSGLVPPGTRFYADLGPSLLDPSGGALKLVWRSPGGTDAPAGGSDVVVDRVELNATTGGTLFWEPGNTILTDAAAPGLGQDAHRSTPCADTDRGTDFVIGSEPGRTLPPTVVLSGPNGGEDWTGGSVHNVPYSISDPLDVSLTDVTVSLSTDGGLTFPTVLDGPVSRPVGSHTLTWTVNLVDTTTARVRVCATNSRALTNCDSSAADFAIDSTPPSVLVLAPASGETDVRLNEPIRVVFSEPMNRVSAEAAVSVSPPASPLAFGWSSADAVLTVDHPDFSTTTLYTVSISTTARDTSDPGNPLTAGAQATFTTSDNRPPSASVSAPSGCVSGGFDHVVTWTMSDPETAAAQLIVYVNYTSATGSGPIVGPVSGATSTTWQAPGALDAAEVRIVVQVFDPRGANRTVMGAPFEVDSTAPSVVSSIPPSGTAGLPPSQPIAITFSEPMNRTATEAAIQISPSVPISLAWSNTTVIVQHPPLAPNATYTVTVGSGARDACVPGTGLASPYSLEFATRANAPPSVQIVQPTGGVVFAAGDSVRIEWIMSDDETPVASLAVTVSYTSSSGSGTIASGDGLTNTTWSIPSLDAADVRIEVVVIDEDGLRSSARTDPFAVRPRGAADYIWIVAVVAAVVVLILVLWLGRRKAPPVAAPPGPAPSPPPAPAVAPPAAPPPATKECPVCHMQVRAEDLVCFYCGHPF